MSFHPHPLTVGFAVLLLVVAVWFGVRSRHTRGRIATMVLDIVPVSYTHLTLPTSDLV